MRVLDLDVVALGGGHGLAASLAGLRRVVSDLTAVVTVADNGGSSGRLREEFRCLPPGDLRMALAALDEGLPDLIILDVMMPEIDGIQLCSMIRQRQDSRDIPILILSARGDAESIMRGMEAGANDYLPKPILHHDLVTKVRSIIAEHGPA